MDDFELIKRCVSGDKESWDVFVGQFTRLIYDSIIRTLRECGHPSDNDMVKDRHQDIFVALLEDDHKILREFQGRNGCRLAHYLRTISARKTIDYLRGFKRMLSLDQQSDDNEVDDSILLKDMSIFHTDKDLSKKEAAEIVDMLLRELNEEERTFCIMFYQDGRAPKDIARHFIISIDHFYVKKQRILKRLKKIAVDKKIIGSLEF